MMLALDVGNTRVKWGLRDGGEWRELGSTETRPMSTLPARLGKLPRAPCVAYSNVSGATGDRAIRAMIQERSARALRIESRASSCGVSNGYQHVDQLGSDRWAALVAAWCMVRGPAVVVNAGTAATVDLLDGEGRFLGGLICPGVGLMLESLQRRSRALRLGSGHLEPIPRNTADAMRTGAVMSLVGAIEKMVTRLNTRCAVSAEIVLSGGDAPLLTGFASARLRRIDNLVLEGVALIAGEELQR
jgi:type III pantothenate kinase